MTNKNGSYNGLSNEELVEIAKDESFSIKERGEAKYELYLRELPLINKKYGEWKGSLTAAGLDYEDYKQEAYILLDYAVKLFDTKRQDAKFTSYFYLTLKIIIDKASKYLDRLGNKIKNECEFETNDNGVSLYNSLEGKDFQKEYNTYLLESITAEYREEVEGDKERALIMDLLLENTPTYKIIDGVMESGTELRKVDVKNLLQNIKDILKTRLLKAGFVCNY